MPKPASGSLQDYGLLTLTTAIWGVNFVVTKLLYAYLLPLDVPFFRLTIGVVLMAAVAWHYRAFSLPPRRVLPNLLLCGLLSVVLNNNLFLIGNSYTDPGNAAMVMALTPLATAVVAVVAAGERLRPKQWAGIALSLAGVMVLIFRGSWQAVSHLRVNPGDVIMLGAMLALALSNVALLQVTRQINALAATFWYTLFGAAMALPLNFGLVGFRPLQPLDLPFWGLILFASVFSTAVANLWWTRGIQRLGAARTAIFMNVVPIFSVLAAAVFLHEPITLAHGAGFLCTALGVRLGTSLPGASLAGDRVACRITEGEG